MVQELQSNLLPIPRDDGRARRLGREVTGGRDGWGSELSPLYMSDIPTNNFVTGGTGTRELTVDEVEEMGAAEHRFVGEAPHEIPTLQPRFDHLMNQQASETRIHNLSEADERLKATRIPEILDELGIAAK